MAVAYYYSSVAGEYTLAGAISASATSVTLDTVTGLPTVPFKLVIEPGGTSEEIVKVTNVAGTNLTVVRGHDGTTGVTHDALAKARHMMTAEDLRLAREHEDATVAHGATGAVVGTTNSQTLTNKNLTSGTNSFPSSLATLTGAQTLSNKTLNEPVVTGTHSGDDLFLGSTTDTTQRMLRVRRLGSDAVSRDARITVSNGPGGNDVAYFLFYKGASQVNSLQLKSDGSSEFQGALTVGGALTATTGTFSGAVTAPSATVNGAAVTTASNTQTLSNKTLSSPALTGAPTLNGVAVPKIASGSLVITIPSGSSNAVVSVDLTSYGFTTIPKVIVSTGVSTHFGHSGTVTTTSAQVGATHRDNTTTGGSVNTYWIAVGG